MLIMHYTGMQSEDAAVNWLANKESGVSAHYVVAEDGRIIQMVDEDNRAHHAGLSHWRGETDINSASIGIEIINPGHEWGYRPFPKVQMDAVATLASEIVQTYNIDKRNVIGHSDIAPERKQDPGELFDWEMLAKCGLAVARPTGNLTEPNWNDAQFLQGLSRYGYAVDDKELVTIAFQRRFRPEKIDGIIDGECRAILWKLLLDYGEGADIG